MARSWEGLSPAYRARLQRAGITRKAYENGAPVTAARGHARTPERPERALKKPDRYEGYLQTRAELVKRVVARKKELFGGTMRYKRNRRGKMVYEKAFNEQESREAVERYNPSMGLMRRFLAMDDFEPFEVIRADTEWEFLFYH